MYEVIVFLQGVRKKIFEIINIKYKSRNLVNFK